MLLHMLVFSERYSMDLVSVVSGPSVKPYMVASLGQSRRTMENCV